MDKQQAKQILINTGYIGNEVGVAFDVAIKSMEKLEKIEKIISERGELAYKHPHDTIYAVEEIIKVLDKE